jgi:hypothetical protein
MPNNYPLQHAWPGAIVTIRDDWLPKWRRTRSSEDGERPTGRAEPRAVGQRRPLQGTRKLQANCILGCVLSCVNRPPVKSTDRPGVAPRKSRDGKGRAQSPHPACGRFEAAHCAAHLATISASCCPPVVDSRFFAGFRKATDSRELDRLNALTKPTTPMRSNYLATVEADAKPESGSVHSALVRPPLPLRVWLTAPASAAR